MGRRGCWLAEEVANGWWNVWTEEMSTPVSILRERLLWLEEENAYLKKQIDVLLMIIANKEKHSGYNVPEV